MSVTICTFGQIASGHDAFFEAAADGDETTALLAAIMQAVFAVAIGGGVSFELFVSTGVWSHIEPSY